MMSKIDSGFSFAQQIRGDARLSGTPATILTAVSSQAELDFRPRSAADLDAMGAGAFFDKPVQPAALLEKIAELLAGRGADGSRRP